MLDDVFFTREQEAKKLNEELIVIRESLRELNRKLATIESRARRAYPLVFTKKTVQKKSKSQKIGDETATMTKEQLLNLFDEVVQRTKDGYEEKAKKVLDGVSYHDLNLLRAELGVTSKSKRPSRAAVINAIQGRVQESVLLSKHIVRPK